MRIEILGPGCRNCALLEKRVREAVDTLGVNADVVKVVDYDEILAKGVMATPGLVIDGQVMLSGKVPTTRAIQEIVHNASH
jgi:small redox-active disulfide protein 2